MMSADSGAGITTTRSSFFESSTHQVEVPPPELVAEITLCPARTTVREVRELSIRVEPLREAELIEVRIEATAFLKHMVRNLVGTLVEVGHGKRSPDSLSDLLDSRDRTRAGPTAPPCGLVLDEVFYLPGNADPHATDSENAADE